MRVPRRSGLALLLLHLGLAASAARAVTVEQIPNPRPKGWAVDLTGTLPSERLAELDRLGDQVKARTGAEMAVVVVGSTDGVDAHAFATDLFHAWRIGEKKKANGLLVFAALTDHKAEIVLGRGLDGAQAREESATVMRENILPRFRAGDPAGAVVQGALGCARRLFDVSPLTAETPEGLGTETETTSDVSTPSASPTGTEPLTETSLAPQPVPYAPPQTLPFTEDPDSSTRSNVEGLLALGAGIALMILLGYLAFRVPRCPKCKTKMRQLDEQEDDAFLEPAQKVEERIGSVDHQIWVCPACGEHKARARSRFSRYTTCPECRAKTLSSTSTTLEAATHYQGGLIEVESACASCTYQNRYTQATPMLVDTTTSSSSSSSSAAVAASASLFSSSPASSTDSSSSSSSSGFSGGDTSGGGASGSW